MKKLILLISVSLSLINCGGPATPPSIKVITHEEMTEKTKKPSLWGVPQVDEEHLYQKFTIELDAGSEGGLSGLSFTHKDCNGHTQQSTWLHPWGVSEVHSCPLFLARGEKKICDVVFKAACAGDIHWEATHWKK